MHKWLVRDNEKRDDHKSRMNSLGNVVVPQQAFLALSVLARMTQGEFFCVNSSEFLLKIQKTGSTSSVA